MERREPLSHAETGLVPIGYVVAAEFERLAELADAPTQRRRLLEAAARADRAGDALAGRDGREMFRDAA